MPLFRDKMDTLTNVTRKSSDPSTFRIQNMVEIIWTDYLRYRAKLRGFDLAKIEDIIRYSNERYFDTSTDRWVVVGKHSGILVMLPHEIDENKMKTR